MGVFRSVFGINHNPDVIRRVVGSRLVYYRSKPDRFFWDDHWKRELTPQFYEKSKAGNLGHLSDLFTRYLPKEGRILEAGCGLAKIVVGLNACGYECEGVEWAEQTVNNVRGLFPDLRIRVGDVTCLEVPDGYYDAYISLGVVEHRVEGPEPYLEEAWRVLSNRGWLLISVPYFNKLRRFKAALGFYREIPTEKDFYQQAFTACEFREVLKQFRFEVIEITSYDSMSCILAEIPVLQPVLRAPFVGGRLKNLLERKRSSRLFGHMVLFVCRKEATP